MFVSCTVKSRYLEVVGTIFYKFKLPEVQNNKVHNKSCKKVPNAKLLLEKAIKMFFDSDRRFEYRRIRDIRVRDIEIRLYLQVFCVCFFYLFTYSFFLVLFFVCCSGGCLLCMLCFLHVPFPFINKSSLKFNTAEKELTTKRLHIIMHYPITLPTFQHNVSYNIRWNFLLWGL